MTLSITGRCARTGQLGSAVSSYDFRWTFLPSFQDSLDPAGLSVVVGGVGAVTAQASSPPTLTASVVGALKRGLRAGEALDTALAENAEEYTELFQLAVVGAAGDSAGFTGQRAQEWRGHKTGEGWVAAGNTLASGRVVDALAETFEAGSDLPLDVRLVAALEAGVAEGGDRRGHRGAVLRVSTDAYVSNVEIRVHEHTDPVAELRRLLDVFHAETDVETVAMRAFASVRSYVEESQLDELGDLTVREATQRLRDVLVEKKAAAEGVSAMDDLVAALANRPDLSEFRFSDAMMLLAGVEGR
jgi:uncharacterized Ntn-hydrolase superfamily protein